MRLNGNIAPGSGSGAFLTGQRLSPLAIRFISESYLAASRVVFKVVSLIVVWAEAVKVDAMKAIKRMRKMFFKCVFVRCAFILVRHCEVRSNLYAGQANCKLLSMSGDCFVPRNDVSASILF